MAATINTKRLNLPMSYNLLVVDDDNDILQFIEILVKSNACNCQLFTASCGKEAIKIVQTQNISLIFLDIYLPDINGYELCTQIKQNPSTRHIPIHLFSASLSAAETFEDEGYPADGIMAKPFDNEEFLRRINTILNCV